MEIVATQKFIRRSPRKIRGILRMIKRLSPKEALDVLELMPQRGALHIRKTIQTAIANAKNKGFSEGSLVFKEMQITEGPRLKRGQPVSRGMWHPIKRRMSHIRVILETKSQEKSKIKNQESRVESEVRSVKREGKTEGES